MAIPLAELRRMAPPAGARVVQRERLFAQLEAGWTQRLTLVSAPDGFGKTTLVSHWLAAAGHAAAWLSLTPGDNDLTPFLRSLTAALQHVAPNIGAGMRSLLGPVQVPPVGGLIALLVDDLAALQRPFVLVLDDYHHVTSPAVKEAIELLIEQAPAQAHLVITCQPAARLPLMRWQAHGELNEIRTADLRFQATEVADVVEHYSNIRLTSDLTAAVAAHTRGSALVLQLLGLLLRNASTPAATVRQFLDTAPDPDSVHLTRTVVAHQPEPRQSFLRATAGLAVCSAPLCDAVTGRSDSAELLAALERDGFPLCRLEAGSTWYAYHQLFAVQAAADQPHSAQLTEQRKRAAAWFAAAGEVEAAIAQALVAADWPLAQELITGHAAPCLRAGRLQGLLDWLDALPDDLVRSDPELATYKGFVLAWLGLGEEAVSYTRAARALLTDAAAPALHGRLLLTSAFYLADIAVFDPLRLAAEIVDLLETADPFFFSSALLLLGIAHKSHNQVPEMVEVYQRLADLEWQDNPFVAATALGEIALAFNAQGQRRIARAVCRQAIEQFRDPQGQPLPALTMVWYAAGLLAYEADDLATARSYYEQSLAVAERSEMVHFALQSQIFLGVRLCLATGDSAGARSVLQQARTLVSDEHFFYPDLLTAEAWVMATQAETRAESSWAEHYQLPPDDELVYYHDQQYLSYVRLLLAQDGLEPAQAMLFRLQRWAERQGLRRIELAVALLQALLAERRGQPDRADERMARAVKIAVPENYRRAFLDEDAAVRALLPRVRYVNPQFVDILLGERH